MIERYLSFLMSFFLLSMLFVVLCIKISIFLVLFLLKLVHFEIEDKFLSLIFFDGKITNLEIYIDENGRIQTDLIMKER